MVKILDVRQMFVFCNEVNAVILVGDGEDDTRLKEELDGVRGALAGGHGGHRKREGLHMESGNIIIRWRRIVGEGVRMDGGFIIEQRFIIR